MSPDLTPAEREALIDAWLGMDFDARPDPSRQDGDDAWVARMTEWIRAALRAVPRLAGEERDRLAGFAEWVMRQHIGTIDGYDIEEVAVRFGLMDAVTCDGTCAECEWAVPGEDICYRPHRLLPGDGRQVVPVTGGSHREALGDQRHAEQERGSAPHVGEVHRFQRRDTGITTPPGEGLTFRRLAVVNVARCNRWHPEGLESWSVADWAVAMAGEAGEVCNAVKKLRRVEDEIANHNEEGRQLDTRAKAIAAIGAEIADTLIYLDLLAVRLGLDLESEVVAKFNAVSDKYGFPERLPVQIAHEGSAE